MIVLLIINPTIDSVFPFPFNLSLFNYQIPQYIIPITLVIPNVTNPQNESIRPVLASSLFFSIFNHFLIYWLIVTYLALNLGNVILEPKVEVYEVEPFNSPYIVITSSSNIFDSPEP